MGRVYAVEPQEGERNGNGCRVFHLGGGKIRFAFRVEFDGDADEGIATVHFHVADANGDVFLECTAPNGAPESTGSACAASFRTWVKIFHPGEPDPRPRAADTPVLIEAHTGD